eukprot:CAMPEP_0198216484 /NCGR_PEP_ID=MMETSP1445-20131203/57751_1 /TAXON_ID=36898 /ORGANISM="Pyramimonas sp., Strain CCMP2087" /LENGTH=46 /DNA_ID= /DNA_START= /DNA_END= /DNA_ORIENTATION=
MSPPSSPLMVSQNEFDEIVASVGREIADDPSDDLEPMPPLGTRLRR